MVAFSILTSTIYKFKTLIKTQGSDNCFNWLINFNSFFILLHSKNRDLNKSKLINFIKYTNVQDFYCKFRKCRNIY